MQRRTPFSARVSPGPANLAFARSPDSYATTPGGDDYLRTNNHTAGNPYAHTVNSVLSGVAGKDLSFERNGYQSYVTDFKGYTEGPGYWGKTFFVWPPDPFPLSPAVTANRASVAAICCIRLA